MSINSTACLFVLSFLSHNAYCREPENTVPLRYERGNLREYMGEAADPNFWPVRGRRNDNYEDSVNPYRIVYLGGDLTFNRGGRKSSEEETTTGVFWAGRGRSSDALDPDDGNFWAHRGRSFEPWSQNSMQGNGLNPEESGWLWIRNGETQSRQELKPTDDREIFCSYTGKTKRDFIRQKLCLLKRKANTLVRELPQSEQFWPVRGKRPTKAVSMVLDDDQFWPMRGIIRDEPWHENLRDLKRFWSGIGDRDEESTTKKDKVPVSGKNT